MTPYNEMYKASVRNLPNESIGAIQTDCRYRIATNPDDRVYVRHQNELISICQEELDRRERQQEQERIHLEGRIALEHDYTNTQLNVLINDVEIALHKHSKLTEAHPWGRTTIDVKEASLRAMFYKMDKLSKEVESYRERDHIIDEVTSNYRAAASKGDTVFHVLQEEIEKEGLKPIERAE